MDDTYKKFAHTMRLDTYLVQEKLIASRSRAKRAIKSGFVVVDSRPIFKPSFEVTRLQIVTVAAAVDKPAGYSKLKEIQGAFELIKTGDVVLDIGASAGGFLWYAAELAESVYAVEFSSSFKRFLDAVAGCYPDKVHIIYADAFSFDFMSLGVDFDVILNDVTAAPNASLELLAKSSAVLKIGGRVLQVLKGKATEGAVEDLKERFETRGFKTLSAMTGQKDELYVIAEKRVTETNAEEGI
jgi:23S rRNA (cytidine1920-2'-O)/16S rRNA (cytidine1409-2'-O)-methyltransferase